MTRQKRQTKESVHYVNNKDFTAAIINIIMPVEKLLRMMKKNLEYQNTLENVFTRLPLDFLLNQILLIIHIEMK